MSKYMFLRFTSFMAGGLISFQTFGTTYTCYASEAESYLSAQNKCILFTPSVSSIGIDCKFGEERFLDSNLSYENNHNGFLAESKNGKAQFIFRILNNEYDDYLNKYFLDVKYGDFYTTMVCEE